MRATVLALVVFALSGFGRAEAAPIFYSESITTDGILGGTVFTGQLVTLTFTADTANVTLTQGTIQGLPFKNYTNNPTVSTVTVAGIGTATLSDAVSLSVFAYPTFSDFSVIDTPLSSDILDTFAVASGFAGYNMKGPLSPVSGGASYSVGTLFGTSLGNFEFTKPGGGVSTVTATTAPAAPEPSCLFLIALGLFSLAAYRTRRENSGSGI
jgi:hypothetical protein